MLATLATTRTTDLTASGDALAAALTGGYHLAFAIAALLMVVATLIAVFVLKSDRTVPAEGHGCEPRATAEPASSEAI